MSTPVSQPSQDAHPPEPPARADTIPAGPAGAGAADRITRFGDGVVVWIARHWLALFNLGLLAFVGIPFLAPMLMHVGAVGPARLLYTVYAPTCHQLPDRSYFLFGEKVVYTLEELEQASVLPGTGLLQRRRYIGDETLGWKVALCERDVAIYGSMVLTGSLFALLRWRVPPLPFKVFLLLLVPIALDGITQLVGLRTSTWWLRTITGGLFGLALVWLAYPYMEGAMIDVLQTTEAKRAAQTGQSDDL